MLAQAAQATISYLKLPQGNSCFPDAEMMNGGPLVLSFSPFSFVPIILIYLVG